MSSRGGGGRGNRGRRGGERGRGYGKLPIRGEPENQGPSPDGAQEVGSRLLGEDEYTKGPPIFRPEGERGVPLPNSKVTTKEDKDTTSFAASSSSSPLQHLDLPLRPNRGRALNTKDSIVLRTNYFGIELAMKKELFKYTVTFQAESDNVPALKNGRKRRQLYNILFEKSDFQNLGEGKATDYAETLITCGRLYETSLPEKKYPLVYRNESEELREGTEDIQPKERMYTVTVRYSDMVPISELVRYIDSRPNDPSDFNARLDTIQALNIIVAGSPKKNGAVFQAGQNKFFQYPRGNFDKTFSEVYDNCDLGGGLIAVRGYFSSIRTSTSRTLLNLNAQCSPFYPEINLRSLMYRFFGGDSIPMSNIADLEHFIRRLRITTEQLTREGETVTREKTVWGFSHTHEQVWKEGRPITNKDGSPKMKGTKGATHDYGHSNSIKFLSDSFSPPKEVSVSEYFSSHYKQPLKFPTDPVINCGTDESPKWIPAERCTVMPGQPYRGTLSDYQTTNMLTIAARGPAENARRITNDGVRVIGIRPRSQTLGSFGIAIDPMMLTVHGRLLKAPQVQYNEELKIPNHAEWNMISLNFHEVKSMSRWSYLCMGSATLPEKSRGQFMNALEICGMGKARPSPSTGFRASLRGTGDDDTNDAAIHNAMQAVSKLQIPILLVVLDSQSAAIYARIKYWADTNFGIHTVCVLEQKLNKFETKDGPARSYFVNVLHKFNLKLGGTNHRLVKSELSVMPKTTMVVGIDVAHPMPGSMENSPSVVSMVASVDDVYTNFPGSVRLQSSRQEIQKLRRESLENGQQVPRDGEEDMVSSSNIASLIESCLYVYHQKNPKTLPDNILVYRDGVSEGQYQAVLDIELKSLQQKCAELYHRVLSRAPPKITIIIVGKRHHTRFYPTDRSHADIKHGQGELCNPLAGTLVDRGITMSKGWDFYLQAHSAIKGTAKPAHYVVLHNGMGLDSTQVETLTHKLSYLYERATKAVSYCTPTYYADLLCSRGRLWLMKHLSPRGKPPGTKFNFADEDGVKLKMSAHPKFHQTMFYL